MITRTIHKAILSGLGLCGLAGADGFWLGWADFGFWFGFLNLAWGFARFYDLWFVWCGTDGCRCVRHTFCGY
jgi:hypothetical protein